MPLCECEYCQNLFNNTGGQKVCPRCAKELDEIFTRIRKYLYSTTERVTTATLVEKLDVPEKAVDYLIREDRLVLDRQGKSIGKCKICGAPTAGGALCEKCQKNFAAGIQKFRQEQAAEKKTKQARSGSVHPMITNKKD